MLGIHFISLSNYAKKSADKKHKNIIKEYMNSVVVIAYAMFFLSTIFTTLSYKNVPLSLGAVIEAIGYIFVAILGYFFLHEKLGKRKILGLVTILIGIIVFNL